MDADRFDTLTKTWAAPSRRGVLRLLAGALAAAAPAGTSAKPKGHKNQKKRKRKKRDDGCRAYCKNLFIEHKGLYDKCVKQCHTCASQAGQAVGLNLCVQWGEFNGIHVALDVQCCGGGRVCCDGSCCAPDKFCCNKSCCSPSSLCCQGQCAPISIDPANCGPAASPVRPPPIAARGCA